LANKDEAADLLARQLRRFLSRRAKYLSVLGILIRFPAILARVLITCYTIDTR
jgi:hypothetical protein